MDKIKICEHCRCELEKNGITMNKLDNLARKTTASEHLQNANHVTLVPDQWRSRFGY